MGGHRDDASSQRGAGRSYPWLSVSRFGRGRLSLRRAAWISATVLIVLGAAGFVMSNQRKDVPDACHPAPLERSIEGDALILRAAALEWGASLFQ